MKFVDFDVGIAPGSLPEGKVRGANFRYRAFVRAIRIGLALRTPTAPWAKFYIQWFPMSGQ